MQLTDQDVAEFKQAYAEAFGETLNDAEAREMGARVLRLYELLAKPLPAADAPLDGKPIRARITVKVETISNTTTVIATVVENSYALLSLLPQVERGRGPPGPVHRVTAPRA
jgi:hypothetical protein